MSAHEASWAASEKDSRPNPLQLILRELPLDSIPCGMFLGSSVEGESKEKTTKPWQECCRRMSWMFQGMLIVTSFRKAQKAKLLKHGGHQRTFNRRVVVAGFDQPNVDRRDQGRFGLANSYLDDIYIYIYMVPPQKKKVYHFYKKTGICSVL